MIGQQLLRLYSSKDSLPDQRKIFQKFAKENKAVELLNAANELSKTKKRKEQKIAAHVLIPEVYFSNPKIGQKIILRLASSDDWEVREEAATVMKGLNDKHFTEMVPVYEKWISTGNNFIQRAICVGLLRLKNDIGVACELIEPILENPDRYVRMNLGPFALAGLLRADEETTLRCLDKWAKSKHEVILWNCVMVFSQNAGKMMPDKGLEMIEKVGKSPSASLPSNKLRTGRINRSDLVKRGCASVLYNVAKYHGRKVRDFIDKNVDKKWFGEIHARAKRYLAKVDIR